MSLDFYLEEADEPRLADNGPRIFVRRNGQNVEISREEWDRLNPGREPVTVSGEEETRLLFTFSANVTHNFGRMADEAGLYRCLWRPNENGIRVGSEMIGFLEAGLALLRAEPERFKKFNPENGWGDYEGLVRFAEGVLAACREHPQATVRVWV
jgi:hypothetical protein